MHSCSLVLCLIIVLRALNHLTEFALNEGNWQVGRKTPMLPNHQLRRLPEGKLVPGPESVKNDLMMLGFKRHLKRLLMKEIRQLDYRMATTSRCDCQV